MTEKEYFEQIKTIRKHIAANRLKRAKRLLDEMYAYKPVRLLWFVAKAEYLLKTKHDPGAALKSLDGKYFLDADYPGMDECIKLRIRALKQAGREQDAVREGYCYQKACGKQCDDLEHALEESLERFGENAEDTEALAALANVFYCTADTVSYFIVRKELLRRGCQENIPEDAGTAQIINYGYLEERIASGSESTFVLVMDEHLDCVLEILGYLLHSLGHRVFLLSPPLTFETEGQLDLEDTLEISWEQMERYPDMCVIPPVALAEEGIVYGDNRGYIIDRICREESARDNAVLLCSGKLLEQLYGKGKLKGRIGRLSSYETDIQEEKVQFGWVGSYLSYISDIYGYDVRRDIEAEPTVDFSILIPARNSAATLRYTLETCLNQRYRGSYEIVVSDNSVDGEGEIYTLCQSLGDPRIRYVKTPRQLQLTKSFEFGYLQTRGAFVLSMGSDDGLLPWGLEALKSVLDRAPEEDIILWERGFYAWPGFNGGQENQFIIPRKYDRGSIATQYVQTQVILNSLKQNAQMIYTAPLLYINSGFRRRYMRKLIEKTGKLWDGANQDVSMGIVNCCINDRILQMGYPITIAGMSSGSVGQLMNAANVEKTDTSLARAYRRLLQIDNLGRWVPLSRERRLYPTQNDAFSIGIALLRAVEEGIISDADADNVLNWREVVSLSVQQFSLLREDYDRFVHWTRFIAGEIRQDEREWFQQELYEKTLEPRYVDEQKLKQLQKGKMYLEGENTYGGETIDASRFGVRNVMEAAQLFEKRSGL